MEFIYPQITRVPPAIVHEMVLLLLFDHYSTYNGRLGRVAKGPETL